MRVRLWRLMIPVLAMAIGGQAARAEVGPAPGVRCEWAIRAAARAHRVPGDLMGAIGMVETGRADPISGTWKPWPWAINAEGRGMFFGSKAEAITAVRGLQATGVRSIDVGCMQVNLMHHPDAFATLDAAFDPNSNASYAAHFLDELFQRSGNWVVAAGWYHSGTADLAADYVRRVMAVLPGGKQSLTSGLGGGARGVVLSTNWRGAAPVVSRDGMLLPSVRLTLKGQVPGRPVERPLPTKVRAGGKVAGSLSERVRIMPAG